MSRYTNPVAYVADKNGKPIVGAKLFFFEPGTTTPKTIYSDSGLNIPTDNPQLSKEGGLYTDNIFLDGVYAVEQQDNSGTPTGYDGELIWSEDPVGDVSTGQLEPWVNDETYDIGEIVLGSDFEYYRSFTNGNQGNDPTTSPEEWEQLQYGRVWNEFFPYDITDSVYGSDGLLYISRIAPNLGNDPTSDSVNWRLFNDEPDLLNNVSFTATVDTKALTFDLKTNGGLNPSSGDKVIASFRGALTSADYTIEQAVAATTITAPDGATLGFSDAQSGFIYFYLVNNAGTLEAGLSGSVLDSTILHTSVAIDATADGGGVLYTTAARTDVAIRLIGRTKIETGAIAGEWDNAPTELFTGTIPKESRGITLGDPVASTSGTSIDFTSIPAGTKRVIFTFQGLSGSGTSGIILQIGGAGGVETSGYLCGVAGSGTTANATDGVLFLAGSGSAAHVHNGSIMLSLLDSATFTWVAQGSNGRSDGAQAYTTGASKSLSAELDRVRLTTQGGSDTFDAGVVNIQYES